MIPPHLSGRRTSRHRILRQLGHGNLTRVFLAAPLRSTPKGELVVLKLMHQELARDDDFRALFLDQAAAALSLRHPNLVRTLEVVAEPDACGLRMEFLQGQTLARVLERVGRLRVPVDLHLHISSQILGALDHAHRGGGARHTAAGFMHRDVCPSNVFITYDGQVKLLGTGFGNALRALESRLGRPLSDMKYTAPEVLLGHPSGPNADVFAVGVMVWEALARQARISSDDPKTVVRRRTRGEELDLVSAWPDAPEPLIALCARALAINPSERYQTALEFRADLDAYLGRAAETSSAVLGRLPELMEVSFGPEREQMQRFIRESLRALDEDAGATEDDDDALAPHEHGPSDNRWTAEPSTDALPAGRDGADAGIRTGLRRAPRPEPALHRATGVHEKGLRQSGALRRSAAEARPAGAAPPTQAAQLLGPRTTPALEPGEPPPRSSVEPPPHETTTAGHRAYSSNLDVSSRARRSGHRLSPDVLGAVALLLGSLVAVYSVYRHAQREKRPEPQRLAIQAEARGLPSTTSSAGRAAPTAPTAAATAPAAPSEPDAGTPAEEQIPRPAFFDGHSAAAPDAPAALNADELPAVDPALRSLQDAIVTAARAHRVALERRRARKAEPAPRPSSPGPAAPRPIDEVDPYTGGLTP